ncbi:ECF transporter S component [Chloroflexota bacterium]
MSFLTYGVTTSMGLILLIYPFLFPAITQKSTLDQARLTEMPLLLTLLLALCLVVLLYEVQGQAVDTKLIALLGILVAINSTLRFMEVAIPGPAGFSPIFFLIILTGYVFGGRFGFLLGVLTIFVSAIVTGGVGPWLPSQMFAAGWVGMSAPLCRPLVNKLDSEGKTSEVIILAIFGAIWGFGYGVIMNLWTWPFITGPADQYWQAGISWVETLQRYGAYYLITSLAWDFIRTAGNFLLILLLGAPTLIALRRFKHRFTFTYRSFNSQHSKLDQRGDTS